MAGFVNKVAGTWRLLPERWFFGLSQNRVQWLAVVNRVTNVAVS